MRIASDYNVFSKKHIVNTIFLLVLSFGFSQNSNFEGYWTSIIGGDYAGKVDLNLIYYPETDSFGGTFQITYEDGMGMSSEELDNVLVDNDEISFYSNYGLITGVLSENKTELAVIIRGGPEDIDTVFEKQEGEFVSGFNEDSDFMSFSDGNEFTDETSSGTNSYILNTFLIAWLVFWLIFIVFFIIYVKRQSKKTINYFSLDSYQTDQSWINEALPLIRIQKKKGIFTRDKGILIHENSISFFRKGRNRNIEFLHEKGSNNTFLEHKVLKKKSKFYINDIDYVHMSQPSKLNNVWIKLKGKTINKSRIQKICLPLSEVPNVIKGLNNTLAEKLQLNTTIKFHRIGSLIVIILFSLFITFSISVGTLQSMYTLSPSYDLWIRVVSLILIHFIVLGIPVTIWILDHSAKAPESGKPKKYKDLSDRRPFRSKWLAIVFKIVAIVFLFLALYKWDIGTFLTYIIVGNILFIAHALAQKDPNKNVKNGSTKPILYLRSFLDDRETTLNPNSTFSNFIGIDPPIKMLDSYDINPRSALYKFLKAAIKYVYNYHPFRLWKLLIGKPIDTSEQQLGNFMAKYGKFTAIGKPGEKIVTTGAARMYVGNDNWKEVVTCLMKDSQFIVIQPSRTSGIWWEIKEVLKYAPPEKLLLCLVNYRGYQNDYEDFRIKMKELIPDSDFVRGLGNSNKIAFAHFDKTWKPIIEPLQYRSRLVWPFYGNALNLNKTLSSFLVKVRNI